MVEKPGKKQKGNGEEVTVVAVGDVVISRQPPEDAFARLLDELKSGTFACCNFEVPLSNKGLPQHGKFETLHAAPGMIDGFVRGGFKVVSLANNHSMDYGPEALLDTIDLIDSPGYPPCRGREERRSCLEARHFSRQVGCALPSSPSPRSLFWDTAPTR